MRFTTTIQSLVRTAETTTTTTVAKHKPGMFGSGGSPLIKYVVLLSLFILIVGVIVSMRPTDKVSGRIGGKVTGISGRMGSGKTYMAVMIAWKHLLAGHDVRTNFTMRLPKKFYEPRLSTTGVATSLGRSEVQLAEKEGRSPSGVAWFHCIARCSVPWEYFTGWEQFATLDNCVVVIDECQLYAPSYKPLAFPLIARWKLAMARKFKLDVYWISQHEDRVNSTLKHLTNMIYVCNAWLDGAWFSAKGYEPEYVRRKGKHIARRSYRFHLENAQRYDTLEIITPDEHLGDEKVSANLGGIHDIAEKYQGRRDLGPCVATTRTGNTCTRRASSDTGLCGQHEKAGQTVEQILEAAHLAGLDTTGAEGTQQKKSRNIFRLVESEESLSFRACKGLREDGGTCNKPTTNDNGLCDDCIARARKSLALVTKA